MAAADRRHDLMVFEADLMSRGAFRTWGAVPHSARTALPGPRRSRTHQSPGECVDEEQAPTAVLVRTGVCRVG